MSRPIALWAIAQCCYHLLWTGNPFGESQRKFCCREFGSHIYPRTKQSRNPPNDPGDPNVWTLTPMTLTFAQFWAMFNMNTPIKFHPYHQNRHLIIDPIGLDPVGVLDLDTYQVSSPSDQGFRKTDIWHLKPMTLTWHIWYHWINMKTPIKFPMKRHWRRPLEAYIF